MDVRMTQQKAGDARSIEGYTAQALSAYFGLALLVLLLLRVLVEMNELLINDRGSLGQYNKDDFSIVSEQQTLGSTIIIH